MLGRGLCSMRIQSRHDHAARGLDAYFSPPEAIQSLLGLEAEHLPRCVWEPAAGDGAIVGPLRQAGFEVIASDIADYGLPLCATGIDYLCATPPKGVSGVITNPPYRLALPFARKAASEMPYGSTPSSHELSRECDPVALLSSVSAGSDLDILSPLTDDASPWLARTARAEQHVLWLVHLGSQDQ